MESVVISIRIPVELLERYEKLAKLTGKTKEYCLTRAVEEGIDSLEHEYRILKDIEDYRAGKLETVTLDELERNLGLID